MKFCIDPSELTGYTIKQFGIERVLAASSGDGVHMVQIALYIDYRWDI